MSNLKGRNLISITDFTKEEYIRILDIAEEFEKNFRQIENLLSRDQKYGTSVPEKCSNKIYKKTPMDRKLSVVLYGDGNNCVQWWKSDFK